MDTQLLFIEKNNGFRLQGILRVKLDGTFVSLYPGVSSSKVIKAIERRGLIWEK